MADPYPHSRLLGVDTGGTFTDLVLVDGERLSCYKLPSTPTDPSRAVLAGIDKLLGTAAATIFHGSTVATNALLEGKGAEVVLITTQGFADLLLIGRQNRPQLYALQPKAGRQTISPERVVEVAERIGPTGEIVAPLTAQEIDRVVAACQRLAVASVAVVLLHSYACPDHERRLGQALAAAGFRVSLSHQILMEYREFERASTTVVNALVSPVMEGYLDTLEHQLLPRALKVMQSNGGSIMAKTAGREAVRTILSGPAGGMVAAFHLARQEGLERIMTFDMGGTSTDVALCDGVIPTTAETVIGDWPVKVPMIDIHTVGAGGGSIARRDAGGALRVGPESAGADPGPVCYGKGDQVTVTDANLYLKRIDRARFLGGRLTLDEKRSSQAIQTLAGQLGLAAEALAEGVVEVAEETMAGALRVVSIERGHDPREFTLVPFGGAGGLHACALAEKLNMDKILFPPLPGLLSALGMVISDSIRDYSHSILQLAPLEPAELERLYAPLEALARQEMVWEQIPTDSVRLVRELDLRYRGQSYEIKVPLSAQLVEQFHQAHQSLYGYSDPQRSVEIVNLRLRAIGQTATPRIEFSPPAPEKPRKTREWTLRMEGRDISCQIVIRDELACGSVLHGPQLILEDTATLLIKPGWRVRVTEQFSLLAERIGDA
ncbi:MAG TPA: hydantoinase/oxoprolinase family protein [Geothermobacteraceae bacterium]|nr:hydantoinase/oxoprolinase family protein [Geothermobacteraceae bacterium]